VYSFNPKVPGRQAMTQKIAGDLVAQGFSVCENFAEPSLVEQLVLETRRRWNDGLFDYARVGQGEEKQRCPSVRSDRIHWLEPHDLEDGQTRYLDALEGLRLAINQATMMGIFEWEGHLAIYPSGTFYRRHLDVFRNARERKISTILYLNQGWTPPDGGELRVYLDGASLDSFVDVAPKAGTLVTFLSEQFYHEVLPAHRERMSITGWFRVRSQ
jgi:SM-20-related protein